MPEQLLRDETKPAEKSFPWRCPKCRQQTVNRVTMPYRCQRTHNGRIVTVEVPNLAVPRCSNCGEIVFDYAADEQIRAAFRSQFGSSEAAINGGQKHRLERDRLLEGEVRRKEVSLLAATTQSLSSQANEDQLVVYFFNNCHIRDHVSIYGSGAFFDLGTSGRQGSQARDLSPGQVCVVGTQAPGNRVKFTWYSFAYETPLPDESGLPGRVFFGRYLASETLSKSKAARSVRYSALFKVNGDFKNGCVFRNLVPLDKRPASIEGNNTVFPENSTFMQGGAGFGDPVENRLVECAAIRAVKKAYVQDGWAVHSVERTKCGFDLVCEKHREIENVEVKGVRGNEQCFIITAGEVEQARKNPKFVLMVVTSALSASPILTRYSGAEFCLRFDLSAIQYRAVLR